MRNWLPVKLWLCMVFWSYKEYQGFFPYISGESVSQLHLSSNSPRSGSLPRGTFSAPCRIFNSILDLWPLEGQSYHPSPDKSKALQCWQTPGGRKVTPSFYDLQLPLCGRKGQKKTGNARCKGFLVQTKFFSPIHILLSCITEPLHLLFFLLIYI